jgi:organic radical activating enzyme
MKPSTARHKMTHGEIEQIRRVRGRSMLLFITDRCPVGCQHCSVDSRPNSPMISDFNLFDNILDWICANSEIEVIGISGGEPFTEQRGLTLTSEKCSAAGKQQVIFTSGIWATNPTPLPWITDILAKCCCVYLSTDVFHSNKVTDSHFIRAAHAIVSAGAWVVVQVLDYKESTDKAERLLRNAFGEDWAKVAEMNVITPLTNGRGSNVFTKTAHLPGHAFGSCSLVRSPMVRYDGLVTGCCNENVIMNHGPSRLRQRISSKQELTDAVRGFHADPLLRIIGSVGLGILTEHPDFSDLSEKEFTDNCHLCWKILERVPNKDKSDNLINALSTLNLEE